jgi:hypothetical protein
MVRIKNRAQAFISHSASADQSKPFVVNFFSRAQSFKVYCVDELEQNSCLASSSSTLYTPGEQVALASPFSFSASSTQDKLLFFLSSVGSDLTISSTKVQGIVPTGSLPTPLDVPALQSRATITHPEAPHFSQNNNFYLDFRTEVLSSPAAVAETYMDDSLLLQFATVPYSIDTKSQFLLDQTAYVPAFKMSSTVAFVINGLDSHQLTLTRIISQPETSSVLTTQTVSSGFTEVGLRVRSAVRGTCNEPLAQFYSQFFFDGKVIIGDIGEINKILFVPGIFQTAGVSVTARTMTNCGPVLSNPLLVQDTTGQPFSLSLPAYMTALLTKLGSNNLEKINTLNIIMLNIWKGFQNCKKNGICLASQTEFISQAALVLDQFPTTLENNKYFMTSVYSLISSFLWEPGLATDAMTVRLLNSMIETSTYLKGQINPLLGANSRLSRALRVGLSNLDLIQAELLEVPILMAANMLTNLLFSYANDTDRNDLLNKTIREIVTQGEVKQVRVSSRNKVESYADDTLKMEAMTVLTPLDPVISIDINSTTKLVFKNLVFANQSEYYDIIVVSWTPALISKMDPIYNQTSNGFIRQTFYFDFRSYFESNVPLSGEGQVLGTNCQTPPTCSASSVADYQVCACFDLNTSTALPPTVTKLPPGSNSTNSTNSTNPSKTPDQPNKGIDKLFTNPNADKLDLDMSSYNNFSAWSYSTMLIFFLFSGNYGLSIRNKNKLKKKSEANAQLVSTQLLIHTLAVVGEQQANLDSQRKTPIRAKVEENPERADSEEDENKSSGSSQPQSDSNMSLTPDAKKLKRQVKKLIEQQEKDNPNCPDDEKVKIDIADNCGYKKMHWFSMYLMYLKLNHPLTSVYYLKSEQYSKFAVLSLNYVRAMSHLAWSMYFTMGSFR